MFKSYIKPTTLVLLSAFLLAACTKIDTTSVGSGLIPGVDNINTFDTTFDIIATNYDAFSQCDSVSSKDLQALGIISNNPLFGSSLADMFLELKPASYPVTLPAHDDLSVVVDSVVLVLSYDHSYGDTTVSQNVKVYQSAQTLRTDSAYQTCNLLPYGTELLGERTFVPQDLKDSVHGFGENSANQLRIPINKSWGDDFIQNISSFTSDSAFKAYFKGFAIIADDAAGGQALNYFSLLAKDTRLSIYVRSAKDTVKDTAMINLTFTSASGSANYIKIDRGSSEITQHLSKPAEGDSMIYIQTSPGSYALLKIPGISDFPNSVIHRAELIAQQVYDPAAAVFEEPTNLYLQIEDPANPGKYIPIPCDFSMSQLQTGFSYLGGRYKIITDTSGNRVSRYTFNISRYIQSIVTKGLSNSTLKLSAPFYIENDAAYSDRCNQLIQPFAYVLNSIGDGGVKLNGTNKTSTRIRLHIIYSKL